MRKSAYIVSIIVGATLILGGIGMWIPVSTTLGDQQNRGVGRR